MINFLFDALLLLILLISFRIGLKKGFINTVAKPVKFVLSLIISFSLARPVGQALIYPIIDAPLSNKIEGYLIEKCSHITAQNVTAELPTLLKLAAGLCGINVEEELTTTGNVIEGLTDMLISPVVTIISTVIAFVFLYILSKITLSLLFHIINSMCDGGITGALNKALGVVFCTSVGFILCWLVTALSDFVFNIPALSSSPLILEFTGWPVYSFFKSISPIDLLLSF